MGLDTRGTEYSMLLFIETVRDIVSSKGLLLSELLTCKVPGEFLCCRVSANDLGSSVFIAL